MSIHTHKTHPQCRVSLISELVPNLTTISTPDLPLAMLAWHLQGLASQLPWAGACHQWVNPFLDVWHMCYTSLPVGLHQRHPRGLPSSGPGDKRPQFKLGAMYEYLGPWAQRPTPTSPKVNCNTFPHVQQNCQS